MTEASNAVCGDNKRDGFIRARLFSRKRMPTFNTKKQFDIFAINRKTGFLLFFIFISSGAPQNIATGKSDFVHLF